MAEMKRSGHSNHSSDKKTDGSQPTEGTQAEPKKRKRHVWRGLLLVLIFLVVIGAVVRAILPWAVRNYVNRTLDRNQLYAGTIGPVRIHLWRGAYSIDDIVLSKRTGNVPVPLFKAKRVDFAVQWDALIHRKIVGRILVDTAEVNIVDAPTEGETQTGSGGPWLQMIQDLFPFDINRAVIQNSSVHFRAYKTPKPVDVYLSELRVTIDNLSNIRRETTPLVASVSASALMMGQAKLDFKMTLDPFSYKPTFHMAMRLLGLDVVKLNDLALAYGKFDFKRGWFDLVVEADAKEGQIAGYVKPLFRDLKVFSLTEDIKEDSVLQFFWQALVGAVTSVLKNPPRDQFGTLLRFTASTDGKTGMDIIGAVINVLRNAFVRAYLPRLENGSEATQYGLQFAPADLTAPVSP
jgi:hypothetical protein